MIEAIQLEGKSASVMYMNNDGLPTSKEEAAAVYIMFADGSTRLGIVPKPAIKGDVAGHAFRGNQYTGGISGEYSAKEREWFTDMVSKQKEFVKNGGHPGVKYDTDVNQEKTTTEDLVKNLQMYSDLMEGRGVEAFVLKQGEPFTVPDTPPDIELGTPKECYSNAGKEVLFGHGNDYVEGYVYDSHLIPIQHAWYVEKGTNSVIDPTLGWRPSAAYYGVRINEDQLRDIILETKVWGAFWKDGIQPTDLLLGKQKGFNYK